MIKIFIDIMRRIIDDDDDAYVLSWQFNSPSMVEICDEMMTIMLVSLQNTI